MENFRYEISSFNPKEKSFEENNSFTDYCKLLFDNKDDFKYLSFTGIRHTELAMLVQSEMNRTPFLDSKHISNEYSELYDILARYYFSINDYHVIWNSEVLSPFSWLLV